MTKQDILDKLTNKLREQQSTMILAAKKTHEAATGEESKQESKYDTRGLEASYLAGAQAEQSKKLSESLIVFEALKPKNFKLTDPISMGALIETEASGEINYYLLTPCAGGLSIDYELSTLTTLSPDAPLYKKLIDCHVGDLLEEEDMIILDLK